MSRLSCVHDQTFVRSPDYSCVHDQTLVRSPDYSFVHDQTFVRSPDYSCVHDQIFVRSPDYSCVHDQTFVRSTDYSCVHVQTFVRFSLFPDHVNLNARHPVVRSSGSGHIDFPSETSTWVVVALNEGIGDTQSDHSNMFTSRPDVEVCDYFVFTISAIDDKNSLLR